MTVWTKSATWKSNVDSILTRCNSAEKKNFGPNVIKDRNPEELLRPANCKKWVSNNHPGAEIDMSRICLESECALLEWGQEELTEVGLGTCFPYPIL